MKRPSRVLAAIGLALSGMAHAHTAPRSSSVWQIDGATVRATLVIPSAEAVRITHGAGDNDDAAGAIGAYLSPRIHVDRDGQACVAGKQSVRAAAPDWTRVALFEFSCGPSGPYRLTSAAFFDLNPTHTHLARVIAPSGIIDEFAFTKSDPAHVVNVEYPAPNTWLATLVDFAYVGVSHIVTGFDHLAFLFALVLMAGSWRRMLTLTCGFTVGHSVTLILASTRLVVPRAPVIEALVAFTVLLVAVQSLGARSRSLLLAIVSSLGVVAIARLAAPSSATDPLLYPGLALACVAFLRLSSDHPQLDAWTHLAATVAFGLVHGLAFASGLLESRIAPGMLVPALAGFNIGVELGQVLFVAAALSLGVLITRLAGTRAAYWGALAASLSLSCVSAWWFIERMSEL